MGKIIVHIKNSSSRGGYKNRGLYLDLQKSDKKDMDADGQKLAQEVWVRYEKCFWAYTSR